jgi:hypothetical protein
MRICFKIGNIEHCYNIPFVEIPIRIIKIGPGPVNYPAFIHDATVLASIEGALEKVSDREVGQALRSGLGSAIQALQKRAGAHVAVHASAPMPG